jgi:hypothetical protein
MPQGGRFHLATTYPGPKLVSRPKASATLLRGHPPIGWNSGTGRHIDLIWPLCNLFDFAPDGRGEKWFPKLSNR